MRHNTGILKTLLAVYMILGISCAALLRDAETAGAVSLWSILLMGNILAGYRVASILGERL